MIISNFLHFFKNVRNVLIGQICKIIFKILQKLLLGFYQLLPNICKLVR